MGWDNSYHILEDEYRCHHCGEYPPEFDPDDIFVPYQILFDSFKFIRESWGKPIPINSGYRCPVHNSMIGGAYLSAHMWGLALDLDCDDVDEVIALAKVIEDIAPDLRRKEYKTDGDSFIHIDCAYYIYPKASYAWNEGFRWT